MLTVGTLLPTLNDLPGPDPSDLAEPVELDNPKFPGLLAALVNRPAFDAHLLSWEGAFHAEQVRPGDAGQGCPSGAGAPRGLSE